MKDKRRRIIIVLVALLLVVQTSLAIGYGFFDFTLVSNNEEFNTGEWYWSDPQISEEFANQIQAYVDNNVYDRNNKKFGYIYNQAPKNDKTVSIKSIEVYDEIWNFDVSSNTYYYDTMGYPVLIDRATDDDGNAVHDINPEYSETDLYEDYNYFIANDVMNSFTHNQYSIRLNYETAMYSKSGIENLTSFSFYTAIGLSDDDDEMSMRDNTYLTVSYSTDGDDWQVLDYVYPSIMTESIDDFDYYEYSIPSYDQGEDIYLKLEYHGYTSYSFSYNYYSYYFGFGRCIIDDLTLNTTD